MNKINPTVLLLAVVLASAVRAEPPKSAGRQSRRFSSRRPNMRRNSANIARRCCSMTEPASKLLPTGRVVARKSLRPGMT